MLLFRIGQDKLIQMESLAFYDLLFMNRVRCIFFFITLLLRILRIWYENIFFPLKYI